jgi:hypothetical protein
VSRRFEPERPPLVWPSHRKINQTFETQPDGDRTPEEAVASGDFKFVLDGERLRGGWVLVRMKWDRKSGKHTNWLLIKHRDKFAQDGNGEVMPHRRPLNCLGAVDGDDRRWQGA